MASFSGFRSTVQSRKVLNLLAFSSVDLENLKCAKCAKYLSVPPIYVYLDPNNTDRNVCGRCEPPLAAIRNTKFESLAKFLTFPCSMSKNCQEKLTWDGVIKHEKTCEHREISCPMCSSNFTVYTLIDHYRETHQTYFHRDENLIMQGHEICELPFSCLFLVINADKAYWLKISVDTVYKIDVQPLLELRCPHTLKVTFSNDNNTLCFKNKPLTNSFTVDLKFIQETFKNEQKFTIKIGLSALDQIENDEQPCCSQNVPSNNNDNETLTTFKTMLVDNLKCPSCFNIMSSKIYSCTTGHSICDFCKNALTECRLCQAPFMGARNFSLEEVYRTYALMI